MWLNVDSLSLFSGFFRYIPQQIINRSELGGFAVVPPSKNTLPIDLNPFEYWPIEACCSLAMDLTVGKFEVGLNRLGVVDLEGRTVQRLSLDVSTLILLGFEVKSE